jgi:hypothetical protein
MNRSNNRLIVFILVSAIIATFASVVSADPGYPIVNNESDCAAQYPGTIAVSIGDGDYECQPDPNYVPPTTNPPNPCSLPTGDVGANACDPCSHVGGDVNAASACNPCGGIAGEVGAAGDPTPNCNPPVVNNPAPANPPAQPGNPGEISFNDSDLGVALVQTQDANGAHVLEVYDMHNHTSNGNFMFSITQDDLAPFAGNPPAANTLLHAEGHVAVYVLSTGEIQMNVGPDSEGKIHVKIFDGIPWTHVYGYVIEPA